MVCIVAIGPCLQREMLEDTYIHPAIGYSEAARAKHETGAPHYLETRFRKEMEEHGGLGLARSVAKDTEYYLCAGPEHTAVSGYYGYSFYLRWMHAFLFLNGVNFTSGTGKTRFYVLAVVSTLYYWYLLFDTHD